MLAKPQKPDAIKGEKHESEDSLDSGPLSKLPRGWKRTVSIVAATLIVGLCIYYLGRNIAPLVSDLSWMENINWQLAGLSLVLFTTGNLLGGVLWFLVLASMDQPCKIGGCVWVSTTSILAKYLPGSAWQMAGRVYLTSRMGPKVQALSSATILDLGTKTATAILISTLAVPITLSEQLLHIPGWTLRLVAIFAFVALLLVPWISRLSWIRQNDRLSRWLPTVSPVWYWGTCAAMIITWGVNAAAYAFLVQSLQNISTSQWMLAAVSLPLSVTAGTFTPFAPAGLGVREAALAATLGTVVKPAIASTAAVASRVMMTAADLVALGIVTVLRKPLTDGVPPLAQKD